VSTIGTPEHLAPILTSEKGRPFACSPAAVLVFILDREERILLLAHPRSSGAWEVVNGAVESEESVLSAVLRETREEVGPTVIVRPLGTIHVYTYRFDENVRAMTSIAYLLAYERGQVMPGDDMAGSAYRWWSLEEILRERPALAVPRQLWLLERAVELHRLWRDRPLPELEGPETH